jgi:circadian clock protein KaiC
MIISNLFTVVGGSTTPVAGTAVSTLVDNIISLRDVELESALRRPLIIFKARGTAHDREIREFEITSKGMIVKEKFVGVEQILGGAARRSITNEAAENLARAFGKKQ